ncbi:SRPBCC family protein [Conexibacter woesei]|uniref:Polyketide cyclase/dehydrase n=1 Tax=Conexibacter woesei (strain DSM 14684 / CCUG 47730 / CIP 108061 / JCM 11494 / NBRC 100937 / ID131577) TaxID=469383 RepID=D3F6E5_CONWI|nr:SRPBCC family protein [Conexibacter woesei]ADB50712.1 conserved hypothetical protein [Conexibacter woesei DSM 14684]
MHTNLTSRSATRSASVPAPPETVIALLGDPQRLSEWAPEFARSIRPDDDGWLVETDAGPQPLEFRIDAEHGTVDLVRPGDTSRGAFIRTIPNRNGSEVVFTLLFPDDVSEDAIAQQMVVVEGELATVRTLCSPRPARDA